VVGTGVLGIEFAEQLRLLQKQVTMVSISSTIMSRHLNATTSKMMRECCEQEQIDLIFHEEVVALNQQADRSFEVTLREGTLTTDLVLFCIGVTPNTALAKTAGLQVNCGIVVDQYLQTSHPDIFAAGDVAEHPGGNITFLWHAAEFQGMVAGENALGGNVLYEQPPFRLKCEVFGQYFFSINKPPDSQLAHYTVIEKTHNTLYQCFYYQEDLLQGVIMVNDKARAKLYEKAVREKWKKDAVEEYFLQYSAAEMSG
jgi:NAD(P)H-nitrite reductase large subunit